MIACFTMPQFGLEVERLRLPHLRGCAVALADDQGCATAVSDEAAMRGVMPGASAAGAQAICQALTMVPYDAETYLAAAREAWDMLAVESSTVEPETAEVCYAELPESLATDIARRLLETLARRFNTPVFVGLAPTCLASREAALRCERKARADLRRAAQSALQPCGTARCLEVISSGGAAAYVATIPIERAPGLDARTRKRLNRLGIKTLGDVRNLPPQMLLSRLGEAGMLLNRMAAGEDGRRLKPLWPPPTLTRGVVFEEETEQMERLHAALESCAAYIAECLRQQAQYCRTVRLTVEMLQTPIVQADERPATPLNSADALLRAAIRLLQRLEITQPVTGVTLKVGELGPGTGVQLTLMDRSPQARGLPHERKRALEATLNRLRAQFGVGIVRYAQLLRQAQRIGLWTYPLGHLANDPVQVVTDPHGAPVQFCRRGCVRHIAQIQDFWRESECVRGAVEEWTVYRVETAEMEVCELHLKKGEWRLASMAD